MKKLICLLLCLMLVIPSALAENEPYKLTEENPVYVWCAEKSLELAGLFNEALHTDGYVALFTVNDFGETIKLLQAQDFSQPRSVTVVRADWALKDAGLGVIAEAVPEANLSMILEDAVWKKAYHAAANFLTAREGVELTALSTVLSFSDAYARPEGLDGPCFAVMQYGGMYALLVTFWPTENGAVTAQAQFIPSRGVNELTMLAE